MAAANADGKPERVLETREPFSEGFDNLETDPVGRDKSARRIAKTEKIRSRRLPLPDGPETDLDDRSAVQIVEKNKRVANRQHFRMGWILSAAVAIFGLLGLAGIIWQTGLGPVSFEKLLGTETPVEGEASGQEAAENQEPVDVQPVPVPE